MSATAGIWNNAGIATHSIAARPQTGTAPSGGSGADSSTISANDFLTLLVTELQNQDPTSQTDPNEYVNQLVAVNSLEQLININQTLGSAVGNPVTGGSVPAPTPTSGGQSNAADSIPASAITAPPTAPGNLSVPASNPSAQRVAQALSGSAR